jgi:hypothetical protein
MHPNYSISTVKTLRFAARVTARALTGRAFDVCGVLTD